jgi:Domain of unknown function (DUF4252)
MYARRLLCAAALLALPLLTSAQDLTLVLPTFSDLKGKATETVDITLGGWPLRMVSQLIDDHDADSAAVKRAISGLKSVQIRSYEFASNVDCPTADLAKLRSQLSSPPWSPIVQSRNGAGKEHVDIYLAIDNHTVRGAAIIACEPREFTILNIVGQVDLDQVAALRNAFTPGHVHAGVPAEQGD